MSSPLRRLLIDITHTALQGSDTGIQRVARCLAKEAIAYSQRHDTQVECLPVIVVDGKFVEVDRWCAARGYRKAKLDLGELLQKLPLFGPTSPYRIRLNRIGNRLEKLLYPRTLDRKIREWVQSTRPPHVPVNPGEGDAILMPDGWWDLPHMFDVVQEARQNGARVGAMVHDLIPIRHPEFFDERMRINFTEWVTRLIHSIDFLVGDAQAAEDDLWQFNQEQGSPLSRDQVGHVRLGCDIGPRKKGDAQKVRANLRHLFADRSKAPYLMVSTIEIRKNHTYLLDAFDRLWADGHDVSLALVGRIGWKCKDLIQRILNHPESGKRLHLLSDIDDNTLNYIYDNSKAFLFSSKAEGFGLPIVEAQHHGLHVFASDIPIFREVAGSGAHFFSLDEPGDLSRQIVQFESQQGWTTEPKVEVVNEPWSQVFPKLVDAVGRLYGDTSNANNSAEKAA
ncbi:glycosyltransferase family 1 protein [Bremerella sp. JC817]|uniref:glycosyltransferase family 4 protein n=1 Tax=Bremerella sp. JC817 TaxID=3231756 RepID=UPI0034595255